MEEELVAEGRLPQTRLTEPEPFASVLDEEDKRCFSLTKRMVAKCREIIVFNAETDNQLQLELAQKEYAKVSKVYRHLCYIRDLDCASTNPLAAKAKQELGLKDIDGLRMLKNVWRVKMQDVSDIYGSSLRLTQRPRSTTTCSEQSSTNTSTPRKRRKSEKCRENVTLERKWTSKTSRRRSGRCCRPTRAASTR